VILDLAFRGLRIVEVPIEVVGTRKFGASKVASNLWKYAWHSLIIMLRAFRDYRPMRFFGGISLGFLVLAIPCGVFTLAHYLVTGRFQPYTFVGFLAGGFGFIGLAFYMIALLAGMINRVRILQDEQLFFLRKREYEKSSDTDKS
jgi:hypothetical protein